MLDMGFADDMEIILGACTREGRQTCLFSATMPSWVKDVACKYMRNHTTIDVVGQNLQCLWLLNISPPFFLLFF
jgi:superfamily II DNA/RNA helicase